MRRIVIGIILLILASLACRAVTPEANATATLLSDTNTPTTTSTTFPPSPTLALTQTSTPKPPTPTVSPTETQLDFKIRTHPDGGLFVGDQISFEVIAPLDLKLEDDLLQITDEQGTKIEAPFAPFGISGRNQATLYWGWDTTDLDKGMQSLEFSIQPLGYTWTHTVTLGMAEEIPASELVAQWTKEESECCLFYYITETAAAREITSIITIADDLAEQTASILEIDFTKPLEVTLMPRVLGQGGFASSEMYISFLDRNYAGNSLEMVLNHEMVHILDHRLGGELRPTILIEGLAVYHSGGHYKPEELIPRAAALLHPEAREDGLGLDWYLPLRPLIDDFYNSQHEIGYIQAGALVEFMIDTWGWEAYAAFYREIYPIENGTQSDAMDAALQTHFGLSLNDLEEKFLLALRNEEITVETLDNVRLTVEFFEAMRRYQQTLDPSAYFLTAWLPNGPTMREKGIVADLVRRRSEIENLALETLLVAANEALIDRNLTGTKDAIVAVNLVIDEIDSGNSTPFDVHPLAKAHYDIAGLLAENGYQIEKIDIANGTAQATASKGWSELTYFEFTETDYRWQFVSNQR